MKRRIKILRARFRRPGKKEEGLRKPKEKEMSRKTDGFN